MALVDDLPNDGSTIYVRLWSKVFPYWAFNDYRFIAMTGGRSPGKGILELPNIH